MMERTLVLGLGNPLLSDDAVGLRVAAALELLLAADPIDGVTVRTSARAGFELLDLMAGTTHAIIVDCLEVPDAVPGRVRRLELRDVSGAARLVGAHDVNIGTLFELAAELGIAMPEWVEIFGVEGEDTRSFGECLTPAVEATVMTLSRDLHAHLRERASPAAR
jgi:hydrogenase maturation protease